jgi:hypothetical protein
VGFSVVKREGVELSGSFGAVEETVNVTGELPIVDVQSATKQRVIGQDLLVGIPTGRTHLTATTLIPGFESEQSRRRWHQYHQHAVKAT